MESKTKIPYFMFSPNCICCYDISCIKPLGNNIKKSEERGNMIEASLE